ncbi:hypothetical protein ACFO3O_12825 [Dokdonia ponticola]|uniref:Uncharacterized protein n=1 Tax=Dokdonia ponticola TaxID=2041041 RepID=A0ABV9HY76_9FLAO
MVLYIFSLLVAAFANLPVGRQERVYANINESSSKNTPLNPLLVEGRFWYEVL